MCEVTINGSVAQFSCKLTIAKTMWDAKGNSAKGKSKESRDINLALDNIKAQIIKHYQRISDREAYVTAEMVRNAYQGIGTEYETLLGAFDKDNEIPTSSRSMKSIFLLMQGYTMEVCGRIVCG